MLSQGGVSKDPKVSELSLDDGMVGGGEREGGGVDERGSMVDGMVGEGGSVDERSSVVSGVVDISVVGCVVTNRGVVDEGGGMDKGSGVVDEGLVGAGNTLVLHVSVVLFVLINKVINNLSPAVGEVDNVLTLDMRTLSSLDARVHVGVAISINFMNVVAKLVVVGDLLMVDSVDKRRSVDKRSSMVDSVMGDRGSVDNGGSMVHRMVGHGGSVDKRSRSIRGSIRRCWGVGCSVRHRGDIGSWCVAVSWDLSHRCRHQGGGNQDQLHL